ncbi:MAG: hypothetical protein MUC63_00430, partial [Planctomycetes bacterium]|nr:hypothetical protein [Planctomycetota bacterium]
MHVRPLPALALALALSLLPGCAWFVAGGVAAVIALASPSAEEENAPAVVITTPVRLTASPSAILYSLLDADGDPCAVAVEYAVGSGAFRPATPGPGGDGTSGLASSGGGTPHLFSWDWSGDPDLTPPETDGVTIRVTATDATGRRGSAASPGHSIGNAPPVVAAVVLPSVPVTGTATVRYTLLDAWADEAEIRVEFRCASTGNLWRTATPDDPIALTNLTTSLAGDPHLFPWDSDAPADLQGQDDTVEIRISASDDGGSTWGAWVSSAAFTPPTVEVLNDTGPAAAIGDVRALQSGMIHLPYAVTDAEGDEVSLAAEFRLHGAAHWRPATAGPGTTPLRFPASSSGTAGAFVWDTVLDGVRNGDATFRLTPSQGNVAGTAATRDFVIGNVSPAAWSSLRALPAKRGGHVCAALGNRIYAIGGFENGAESSAVHAYDPGNDTWVAGTPLPSTRTSAACAAARGRIYVMGGWYGGVQNTTLAYDPVQNAWSSKAVLPGPVCSTGAAVVAETIYVPGGTVDGSNNTNNLYAYDPAADAWSTLTSMPTVRRSAGVQAAGGRIYVMGGIPGNSPPGLTRVERYDPASNTWNDPLGNPVADLPTGDWAFASASSGGRIYAMSGQSAGTGSTVHEYDPFSNTWRGAPSLAPYRKDCCAVVLNGKMYAAGGYTSEYLDELQVLDFSFASWRAGLAGIPTARSAPGVAAAGGKVWVIGGWGGMASVSTVEAYDRWTNSWATGLAAAPTPRRSFPCVPVGRRIYALSGEFLSSVEAYDTVSDTWITGLRDIPTARAGAAGAEIGGRIYVAGTVGVNQRRLEAYDVAADTWITGLPDMPRDRSFHACAAFGGRLYALGGDGEGTFDLPVDVYDPATNTWSSGARMPTGRRNLCCAIVDSLIYAIGGGTDVIHDMNVVEAYDPASDTWFTTGVMPSWRENLACAVVRGRIYALAGSYSSLLTTNEEYQTTRQMANFTGIANLSAGVSEAALAASGNRVFRFGGRTQTSAATAGVEALLAVEDVPATGPFERNPAWTAVAPMPTARRGVAAAEAGGIVYACGGFDAAGAASAAFESYDPAANTWTARAAMPTARGALGFARIGSKLYAVGGDANGDATAGGNTGAVESYDPATATWTTGIAAMPTARSRFAFAADPEGRIHAFGGESDGTPFLATVERFDTVLGSWATLASMPVALRRSLALFERDEFKVLGGEYLHASLGATCTDRVWILVRSANLWSESEARLPAPARDLCGCVAS